MTDLVGDIANCSITAWPALTPEYECNHSHTKLNKEDIVFCQAFNIFHNKQ